MNDRLDGMKNRYDSLSEITFNGVPLKDISRIGGPEGVVDKYSEVNDWDRQKLTEYLEGRGFAVHDEETDFKLRVAVKLDMQSQDA